MNATANNTKNRKMVHSVASKNVGRPSVIPDAKAKIIALTKENGGALSIGIIELAKRIGHSPSTVQTVLREMVEDGNLDVKRSRPNLYSIPVTMPSKIVRAEAKERAAKKEPSPASKSVSSDVNIALHRGDKLVITFS